MFRPTVLRLMSFVALGLIGLAGGDVLTADAHAGANPKITNYGWGQIIADPHYPIVGETATISVTIRNDGDAPATNVQVNLSFNDWGVTFMGWQQMGTTQTIPSIPAGGSAVATVTHVFQNRTHTCVEALIVGADENTNLFDDRGQITLEVVNSGENFSYDVPVVNNGEGALAVNVNGALFGREAQGVPHEIPVDVVPNELVLEPGETGFVHVEINLAAVPLPPGPVFLRIEAAEQANPDNRNNVIFGIRRTSARQLKSEALDALQALIPDLPTRPFRNLANDAAGHVRKSLETRFWKPGDPNRVVRNGGASVFAQEAAAAHALDGLMARDIEQPLKVRIDEIIRMIVDADRILAETAIADAGSPPDAVEERAEGDEDRQQAEYPEAIRNYGKAWGKAVRP